MLGLGASLAKGGASLLTYVKDNLKLYLDFKSSRSDTLAFPSEGSTSFDGVDDRIDCGQIDVSGQSITLSAWVYRDGTTDDAIVGRWHSNGCMLYAGSTSCNFYVNGGVSSTLIPDKTWVHMVGTFDGVNRKVYKNGVLEDTDADTSTIVNPSENFEIGNAEFSSGKAFKGKLANVAMWSRALSLEEVQSVMNKSYSQLGSVEKTSLVMWQSLDSASNGAVQPASGETLSSEVNTVANATNPTNEVNSSTGWESGVYASLPSPVAEGYTGSYSLKVATSINLGFTQTSSAWTVDNDSIYKLSITWKTESTNTDEWSYGWGTTQVNASYGIEYEDGSTDWVTSVKYIKTTSTDLHLYLQEQNSTSNALALYVDSISIKKVTSNTGVLK